jgi:DNA-directed RNA polymerase subunit RPC12/RpoP
MNRRIILGTAIAIWFFGTIIFFFILYSVIRAALDDSKLAKNIQDIRDILYKEKSKIINNNVKEEELVEECPACGRKVKQNETTCPECGLKLLDEKAN